MEVSLPYPGEDGRTIRPGNIFDIWDWRVWLANLDFEINDVYQIDFHSDNRCTVHRYPPGRRYLFGPREVATLDPVTITYRTPPPVWT